MRELHAPQEYLAPLARILHATGHSQSVLVREFTQICRALPERPNRARTRAAAHLRDLPHVLAHWHTDPQFLDTQGRPLPLPRLGKVSIAALIRRVYPRQDLREVMEALKRNQAIQRKGRRYLPTGRSIRYATSEVPAHGLEALRGLLRTLDRNLTPNRRAKRLFERFASNPRVPVRLVARFDRHVRRQALEFLFGLDAILGRLESGRRGSERTARVGVGVYLFEEPAEWSRVTRRSRRTSTRRLR